MLRTCVFGLGLLVACSDGSRVGFVGLEDGAVLGGPQTTEIETDASVAAVRVELFLDDERVGEDPFAPFAVEWTTVGFDEGRAELRARSYLTDGTSRDGIVEVIIDNTPPEISELPVELATGDEIEVHVFDEHRIVSVELDGPPAVARTWDAPPYTLRWEADSDAMVTVTAVDEAGWSTTREATILLLRRDGDGDGYGAGSIPGTDCNDADPDVHPGVEDDGRFGDPNCDGVPGTDRDGDGIASALRGGRDCDDANPDIHPEGYVYGSHPLEMDGQAISWEPGRAAMAFTILDSWRTLLIAINERGTLDVVTVQPDDERATRTTVAAGVSPAPPAAFDTGEDVYFFYGAKFAVMALVLRDGSWSEELVMNVDSEVEQLTVDQNALSAVPSVAVRTAGALHVARRDGKQGAPWRSRMAVEDPGLADAPMGLAAFADRAVISYVSGPSLVQASAPWNEQEPVFVGAIGVAPDPDVLFAVCHSGDGFAIHVADGCLVTSGSPPQQLTTCGPPVRRLMCTTADDVHFQLESGVMGHYSSYGGADYLAATGELSALGPYGQPVFASPGTYSWVDSGIEAPSDPIDDIDRDCDGLDD